MCSTVGLCTPEQLTVAGLRATSTVYLGCSVLNAPCSLLFLELEQAGVAGVMSVGIEVGVAAAEGNGDRTVDRL